MNLSRIVLILFAFCLFDSYSNTLFGQFINDKGRVDTAQVTEYLLSALDSDGEFKAAKDSITLSLIKYMNQDVTQNQYRNAKRYIMHLGFLSREGFKRQQFGEPEPPPDTLSHEVRQVVSEVDSLEKRLLLLYDSLQLMVDQKNTRASKEQIVKTLARSDDLSHINFLMENHRKLEFFEFWEFRDFDMFYDRYDFCYPTRTAFSTLVFDKVSLFGREKLERNWVLIPFMIEHLGVPATKENFCGTDNLEQLSLLSYLKGYQKPWLVTEFMYYNMAEERRPNAEYLLELFAREKKEFLENNSKKDHSQTQEKD